jgi:hypothetical protein
VIVLPFSQHASRFEGDTALEAAKQNIDRLIADAGLKSVSIMCHYRGYSDGYYNYKLHRWLRVCNVAMPGLPLERVRFLGLQDQDIWRFPRLYVDGGSWVWKYAVGILRGCLLSAGCRTEEGTE